MSDPLDCPSPLTSMMGRASAALFDDLLVREGSRPAAGNSHGSSAVSRIPSRTGWEQR